MFDGVLEVVPPQFWVNELVGQGRGSPLADLCFGSSRNSLKISKVFADYLFLCVKMPLKGQAHHSNSFRVRMICFGSLQANTSCSVKWAFFWFNSKETVRDHLTNLTIFKVIIQTIGG